MHLEYFNWEATLAVTAVHGYPFSHKKASPLNSTGNGIPHQTIPGNWMHDRGKMVRF
jgi:hypothetical protein